MLESQSWMMTGKQVSEHWTSNHTITTEEVGYSKVYYIRILKILNIVNNLYHKFAYKCILKFLVLC